MAEFLELDDFFRKLWAPPADPFRCVAELSGEEFRHVKNRRTFRVELAGRAALLGMSVPLLGRLAQGISELLI